MYTQFTWAAHPALLSARTGHRAEPRTCQKTTRSWYCWCWYWYYYWQWQECIYDCRWLTDECKLPLSRLKLHNIHWPKPNLIISPSFQHPFLPLTPLGPSDSAEDHPSMRRGHRYKGCIRRVTGGRDIHADDGDEYTYYYCGYLYGLPCKILLCLYSVHYYTIY